MLIVGLTGSFGTGKSSVAGMFASLGAKVIDADRIAHGVLKKGSAAYKKVVANFGPAVLRAGREIDRRKLAGIVFGDEKALRKLNSIVHPEVIRGINEGLKKAVKEDVVVIDAPLLIEAGLKGMVDRLVVVKCPKSEQVSRCISKFGLNKEEVLRIIKNQMALKKKIKMADIVIDNGGSKAVTKTKVKKIWRRMVWR